MKTNDKYFDFAMQTTLAATGLDKTAGAEALGTARVMDSPEAEPFNRELCKIAAAACAVDEVNALSILFDNLSKTASWHPGFNMFTDSVKRAMARVAASAEMQKVALALPMSVAATANDKLGGGLLKTLTAAGAVGGTGLGALAFLLSRSAEQTSAENAAILEKVRTYRQLRKEIAEDMEGSSLLPVKKRKRALAEGGESYDV